MKNIAPAIAALLFAATSTAQNPSSALPHHLDPSVASIGKELPRSEVVSHDSKADAVRGAYGASRYLQPLTEWSRSETADAVTYSTQFKIPFGWIDRQQFLYLGRASGAFDVAVNGARVAYSQAGGTPGEFDVTKAAREGMNDLAVTIYRTSAGQKLENGRPAPPPAIEGEAHILSQPRERVRDVTVSTRMEGTSGLVELGVVFKSHRLNAHDYAVQWELLNPAGEIVAEGAKEARLDMRREDTVRFFANIPRVVPWSHEAPHLYTLYIRTRNEGRLREHLSMKVGFRSVALDPADGTLYLNGTPLGLSTRPFAPTADMAAMRRELERMRAGGGPVGLMLTASPPDRAFFSLCDSLGVYVACRADIDTHAAGPSRKRGGNPSNDPAWRAAYLDRTMAMYHSAKNHPSVVIFSLAGPSANGYNLYESYTALKALERHRPVIYTSAAGEWNSDAVDLSAAGATTGNDGFATGTEGDATGSAASSADSRRTRSRAAASNAPSASAPWLGFEAVDAAAGLFRLSNMRTFTPFAGEAQYAVKVGRKVVASGTVAVEAMPGETTEFTVPVTGTRPGKPYTVVVEIAIERPDGDYLPDGDPNLKVYRRTDLPIPAAARAVVATAEHRITFKKKR